MVSQSGRSKAGSRERLLQAAAEEFAARGFDGAKVDRIAKRARVNKAMLYYHFHNKAALYREILGTLFSGLAAEVATVREDGGPADDQIRRYIRTVAAVTVAVPHFPAIWLREMAEGGRHLDAHIAGSIASVLKTLGAMLEEGRAAGLFRPAHPLITQMGIVAPLILFAASAPARERFKSKVPASVVLVPREAVVAHVEATTLAALRVEPSITDSSTRRPS
ncbi:MAG: TetR/AcrR family transcriptional regulator [Acidobacteriota bacterium]